MTDIKKTLRAELDAMSTENERKISTLTKTAGITEYEEYTKEVNGLKIWTEAFNRALSENETVTVPGGTYYIDASIIMHSNNAIKAAPDAVIKKAPGMKLLMLRNENVIDETKMPAGGVRKDVNISVEGGIWDGSAIKRGIYGGADGDGLFDSEDSMNGIYTSMLFSGAECVTVKNLKFLNSPGFSLQTGNAKNLYFCNIEFCGCFADGLHINGNTENVLAEHIRGQVGDDIVALNMYDWDNSSINFGPMKNVWCEDVELYEDGEYKAIRIQPGVYQFADGSEVSCDADRIVLKNIRGINNFKLYLQTNVYDLAKPDIRKPGRGSDIFFEDIAVSLDKPIDELPPYMNSDPVCGAIAGFEFGAQLESVHFENIRLTTYPEKYPYSYLATVGPKSCLLEGHLEVFDPYLTTEVENLYLKDIYVNGEKNDEPEKYIREICFDNIYDSPYASGSGKIKNINKN